MLPQFKEFINYLHLAITLITWLITSQRSLKMEKRQFTLYLFLFIAHLSYPVTQQREDDVLRKICNHILEPTDYQKDLFKENINKSKNNLQVEVHVF